MRDASCADGDEPRPLFVALKRGLASVSPPSPLSGRRLAVDTYIQQNMSTAEVDSTPSAVSLANFGRRKGVDDSWKKIQERVFKNWMNDRLRGNLKVAQMQVRWKAGVL